MGTGAPGGGAGGKRVLNIVFGNAAGFGVKGGMGAINSTKYNSPIVRFGLRFGGIKWTKHNGFVTFDATLNGRGAARRHAALSGSAVCSFLLRIRVFGAALWSNSGLPAPRATNRSRLFLPWGVLVGLSHS